MMGLWSGRDDSVIRAGHDSPVTLRPISAYARDLRPALPASIFAVVPSRLAWLSLHVALATLGVIGIALGWGGLVAAPFFSLLIGHAFAGCAFVGHETMHGAVVRHRRLRHAIGWLCFLPFTLSPRLWHAWHNRVHHGHTGEVGVDPDAYPTTAQWRASRVTRAADRLSFGGGRLAGLVTLAIGFTGQSAQMLWRWAPGVMPRRERALAIVETFAGLAVWGALAWALGPLGFVFAYVLPLFVGNAIVIAYILTNHSLSPLTDVNDPLVNSLSVTTPRFVEILHLNFGMHVEHHLFPSMSSKFAPLVRAQLLARWPHRYQSLPLFTALGRLWSTPRVYASPTRLEDPRSGRSAPTLMPRPAGLPARGGVAEPAEAAPLVPLPALESRFR